MQTLTNLLDSNPGSRVNWIWWTISGGTDTPGAGVYGALNTWGKILRYRVVFLADLNNDCKVDLFDAAKVALAYGAKFGDGRYSAALDINNNGIIDLYDAAYVTFYYDQTCTYKG